MRAPPARAPEAPEYLGPYRVLGVLGRGGMGIVYRGEHVDTGEAAAVKTVRATSRAMLATIRREIHALSRVRHPGIIRVVAQGVADGLPWYAMPLLPGPTLRDSVCPQGFEPAAGLGLGPLERTETMPALAPPGPERSRGPSPRPPSTAASLGSALLLLRRLCAPLAFLHGCGLVHRGLKPENVVIHEDGRPILVDLGIAALSGGAEGREEL
ncbi:protein kinase domain-containing protein, partial [Corallococcus llansteffanensis]